VVDAKGEHVVSFEALVRWNSAEHGFVSPASSSRWPRTPG
jgi:EAL domain-containing protein (putative c-di-GMP-specific phosphodiesterase class I)